MTDVPQPLYPRPPAHVAPFVEVLGVDLAIEYFIEFGGTPVYLAKNPAGRSEVEALIGAEAVRALRDHPYQLPARCPLPKKWMAQVLYAKGLPVLQIARKLKTTDVAVRRNIADIRSDRANRRADRQLNLF